MGTRNTPFLEGEFYHIYNRGNSKQVIFKDQFDYQRFQILLYLSNSTNYFKVENLRRDKIDFFKADREKELVAIGSYCLMPNHFHILLTPLMEDGVSLFMKKLGTGYSMFFNNRYERTGTLFEGRFKSKWADNDEYLKYLYSYIHLNPMKLINKDWKDSQLTDGSIKFLQDYQYGSYWDYCHPNKRREWGILNRQPFPDYFNRQENISHVYDWFRARTDLALG